METNQPADGFFGRLHYDIRINIYRYMRLPPVTNGQEVSGFILSCRQALAETTEAAPECVFEYLKDLKVDVMWATGQLLGIPKMPDLRQQIPVRNITLTVGLKGSEDEAPKIASVLAPLLLMRLDMLRVELYGGPEHPAHGNSSALGKFLESIKRTLHTVAMHIAKHNGNMYKDAQQLYDYSVREIGEGRVQTSHIVFAWDLRASEGPMKDVRLHGDVRGPQVLEYAVVNDYCDVPKDLPYWPRSHWANSGDLMVGEHGILSNDCWQVDARGWGIMSIVDKRMNHRFFPFVNCHYWKAGFTKEIKEGKASTLRDEWDLSHSR